MQINILDEVIECMVKEQVETSVRKRIKEMQGNYTSKGYLEDLIRDVIWDKVLEMCPDIECYIHSEVERCIDYAFNEGNNLNLTKKQLVENIVDSLLERFSA